MKYRLLASALPLLWLIFFIVAVETHGDERPGQTLAALVLVIVPVTVAAFVAGRFEGINEHKKTTNQNVESLDKLKAENKKMRGIIARNSIQRLRGDDATELHVTADDIKESLEILYEWNNEHKKPEDVRPVPPATPPGGINPDNVEHEDAFAREMIARCLNSGKMIIANRDKDGKVNVTEHDITKGQ